MSKVTKQTATKKRVDSAEAIEKRKLKTALVKSAIRREWAALDRYFRDGQCQLRPATPTLDRLTKMAASDFRQRSLDDARTLRVYWEIRGGDSITSRYICSNFGGLRLMPPKKYRYAREAMLPDNLK